MANVKISAMPSAGQVHTGDVFPIVQSGVNKKATRSTFLTIHAGESFYINGNGGSRLLDTAGDITDVAATNWIAQAGSSSNQVFVQAGFQVGLTADLGTPITLFQTGGGGLGITDTDTTLGYNNNIVQLSDTTGVYIHAASGKNFSVVSDDGPAVLWSASSNTLYVNTPDANNVHVGTKFGFVDFFSGGTIAFTLPAGVPITIPFQTANPSDWSGTPGTYEDALNRLAAAVAGLLGGPIP